MESKIGKCDECEYRGIDGGPSPAMVCEHPNADGMGYIIEWNDKRTERFSNDCPMSKPIRMTLL
jgi:hypothetical protein